MSHDLRPTDPNDAQLGAAKHSEGTGAESHSLADGKRPSTLDDSTAFDLLERPQDWPDDPILQAELADLLEIHLAMGAHADDLAPALTGHRGFSKFAGWLLPAAAALFAILPATYVFAQIREARNMRARGAVLEADLQKRIQARLWSDFFEESLDLLKHVENPVKFCDPAREDRSFEVVQARKLYAVGHSLPSDGLNDPEALEAKVDLQNWLTEVSANDDCMTPERSLELLALAQAMNLEDKTNKLNTKLRGAYP
jgi:hypothetical protein